MTKVVFSPIHSSKKSFSKICSNFASSYQTQPSWYWGWPNTPRWGQSSMLKGTFQRVDLSHDKRYICRLLKYIYLDWLRWGSFLTTSSRNVRCYRFDVNVMTELAPSRMAVLPDPYRYLVARPQYRKNKVST